MASAATHFPDAHAFLTGTRPVGYRGPVYVVGGRGEVRATFYAQQCRALNVVAAMKQARANLTNERVAVVGAGAAGMTAAAALRRLGVDVLLYDRAAAPLSPQRASLTRYLHPRLFHWPEAGWDDARAALPLGAWSAGYADAVRDEVLSELGGPLIQFCTEAVDVLDAESPLLRLRRLGEYGVAEEAFDAIVVATGFPTERPAPGTHGGSYWHEIEPLSLRGTTVHVAGDGDGALTEVLMLFIDRLGHRGVEALAGLLEPSDEVRDADFLAHGQPDENADPPVVCRSADLLDILELLDDGDTRVVIHADRALKGKSFLLNRVLVAHLRWTRRAPVDVVPKNLRAGEHLADSVIWRIGLADAVPARRFELSRLATSRVLARVSSPDPEFAGLLAQTVDSLRRPLWTRAFETAIRGGSPWSPVPPGTLSPACGALTEACAGELLSICDTFQSLEAMRVPFRPDSAFRSADGTVWISIETIARCTSIPHEACVTPTPLPEALTAVDDAGRLWFRCVATAGHGLRGGSSPARNQRPEEPPTRRAVAALVSARDQLEYWYALGDVRLRDVHPDILRGFTDLAKPNGRLVRAIANTHHDLGRTDDAIEAFLRTARIPDIALGRNYGATHVRQAMLGVAKVLTSDHGGQVALFAPGDEWILLAAAASRLRTPAAAEAMFVSRNFFVNQWAPRVRMLADHGHVPGWFGEVAEKAFEIEEEAHAYRSGGLREQVDEITRAAMRAKLDRAHGRGPVARFGVWLEPADAGA